MAPFPSSSAVSRPASGPRVSSARATFPSTSAGATEAGGEVGNVLERLVCHGTRAYACRTCVCRPERGTHGRDPGAGAGRAAGQGHLSRSRHLATVSAIACVPSSPQLTAKVRLGQLAARVVLLHGFPGAACELVLRGVSFDEGQGDGRRPVGDLRHRRSGRVPALEAARDVDRLLGRRVRGQADREGHVHGPGLGAAGNLAGKVRAVEAGVDLPYGEHVFVA